MKVKTFIAIIILATVQSCTTEYSIPTCGIIFKGNLDFSSKANSYLNYGVKVSIFTYKSLVGNPINFTPETSLFSDGYGNISSNEIITLPAGLYNFFSISYNNQYTPNINFNNNLLATPQNGKDYLWACKKSQAIRGKHIIRLIYKHISTKVKIVVDAPPSFENLAINYIKFTLPDCSNSSIDLKSGEITSSTSVLPLSQLQGVGNSRTIITIPCSAPKEVEVSINATIAGEVARNVVYNTSISTPFKGGTFYIINLSIEDLLNSSLTLSCKEWSYISNNIPY